MVVSDYQFVQQEYFRPRPLRGKQLTTRQVNRNLLADLDSSNTRVFVAANIERQLTLPRHILKDSIG